MIDIINNPLLTSIIVISLSIILILAHKLKNKSKSSNKSHLLLRPCPNPNCIRCELYKTAQESAKKRLPYIMKDIQKKSDNAENRCDLERVITSMKDPNVARLSAVDGQYPSVLFLPGLPVHAIATHLHEPLVQMFQKYIYLKDIRTEYLNSQTMKNEGNWQINFTGSVPNAYDSNTSPNPSWQVLYLMNQGQWMHENIKNFPYTYSKLKQMLPFIMEKCILGNVFFSVIHPGTLIEEHCGPTNTRHRLHYPIISPSHTTPILKVLDRSLGWFEGEAFVFDDSLVHSVEYLDDNDVSSSQCSRVVLIIDIWHPDLSDDEKELITALYPSRN